MLFCKQMACFIVFLKAKSHAIHFFANTSERLDFK